MAATAGLSLALSIPRLAERPLWLDEAFTVGATNELGPTLRHTGGTMALYYALLTPWSWISDSRFWLRLPSALIAAATVAVVYAIGHRLGGRRMATVASSLLAASWFLSRYAMEARGYALALLLVSVSWLGLISALAEADGGDEEASRRWWWVFAAAAVLAPLAHGLSALQVPFQVVVLLLAPGGRAFVRRLLPVLAVLFVEGIVLFAIGAGEVASWIQPLNWTQVSGFLRLLLGRETTLWVVGAAFVGGIGVSLRALRRERTTETWLGLVPVIWALGLPLAIIAISVVRPYAASRYVLSSLPGISLVVAALVVQIKRPVAYAAWAVLLVFLLLDQPQSVRNGLEDWPRLVHRTTTEASPGDLLLMPQHLRAPFDYALEHGNTDPGLHPLSPTNPIGDPLRLYSPAKGTMVARLLAAPPATVWLVDRSRLDLPALKRLLANAEVRAKYRQTGHWTYAGQLYLIRLEPRVPAQP